MASRNQKCSGRERELDSFVRKTADHSEINLLLDIHVEVVMDRKIDDLKLARSLNFKCADEGVLSRPNSADMKEWRSFARRIVG